MKYYLADPALIFYDASQGSCVEEFQVQVHPTWKNCPLGIRTVFSNHRNLITDVFYNPNGKNWQGSTIPHHLIGNRIIEGTTYPYLWIPVSRIQYEHIIQAKQAHKTVNPPSVQWNHNGSIHDPLGCHVWVGFTDPPGTRPTYSCISDFGDQNLSITDLSTSIPCAKAFAMFRIDVPRAEAERCIFSRDWKGFVNCGQPLPEHVFDQGVILRPERIKPSDTLLPKDSDQRKQQQ